MSAYVTRQELDQAIAVVVSDIRETEERLRQEFTGAVRFEISRVDGHLKEQDHTLKWINRWILGVLLTVIAALIAAPFYLHQ